MRLPGSPPAADTPRRRHAPRRMPIALAVLVICAFAAAALHPAVRELLGAWSVASIRERLVALGLWAWAFSALLMVLQAIVSPFPAFVITIANGYVFGWLGGAVLSLLSATVAAQICFEIARAVGRPALERWMGGGVLEVADRFFEKHGVWAILIARLLPFVPFDPISYAAGLTSTSRARFIAANLAGQAPATLVYSTLGSGLEQGRLPWELAAGLGGVAVIAFGVAAWSARRRVREGDVQREEDGGRKETGGGVGEGAGGGRKDITASSP